jgi:type I restriction enzyme S subunit
MAVKVETLDLIGDLPPSWKVARFGDLLEGGTRNGIYKAKDFHGRGAKIVNMGELFAHPRLRDVPMKRVELSDSEMEKSCLKKDDLLFARRSLVAEGAGKCIVVAEVKEPTTFESSIIRARPNPQVVDSLFLYYLFNSPYGAYVLQTIRRQVAVSGITGTDLVELPVPIPPLAEQKAIAAVLGTLDDKIELNRRMNVTLEAMARALFQSWFVDFDPVRAKLDGRQPVGLDQATAALFPESFEETAFGHVPNGWGRKQLGEIVELAYGKPLKAEDRKHGSVCVYGANGPVGWHDEKLVSGPGIVVGRKGNPGVVTWAHGDFYPIDTTFYVEPIGTCRSLYFLYYALLLHNLANLSADSAVPGLNRNHAYVSMQVIPSQPVLTAFDSQIAPIFAAMHAIAEQTRSLALARDTLLPKLISGELAVPVKASSE